MSIIPRPPAPRTKTHTTGMVSSGTRPMRHGTPGRKTPSAPGANIQGYRHLRLRARPNSALTLLKGTISTDVARVTMDGTSRWVTTMSISPTLGIGSPSASWAQANEAPPRLRPRRMRLKLLRGQLEVAERYSSAPPGLGAVDVDEDVLGHIAHKSGEQRRKRIVKFSMGVFPIVPGRGVIGRSRPTLRLAFEERPRIPALGGRCR